MEKDRSARVIALVALLIGVIGLSVGFAAFSRELDIKSSAEVKPINTFDVIFSSSGTAQEENPVVASFTSVRDDATVTTTDAVINNELTNPTISNLKATFSYPGQTATYSFYSHNVGEYAAFLNAVTFKEVGETGKTKVCTAVEGTDQALVDAACEGISISVKVAGKTFTTTDTEVTSDELAVDGYENVVVTMTYAEGSELADGDFTVDFGDITLLYKSQQ